MSRQDCGIYVCTVLCKVKNKRLAIDSTFHYLCIFFFKLTIYYVLNYTFILTQAEACNILFTIASLPYVDVLTKSIRTSGYCNNCNHTDLQFHRCLVLLAPKLSIQLESLYAIKAMFICMFHSCRLAVQQCVSSLASTTCNNQFVSFHSFL